MSKNYGLPIPFIEHVPDIFRQDADDSMTALADKMDSIMGTVVAEILRLYDLKLPDQCPTGLLDELGHYLAAGILNTDTERIKREKIATAVQGHKVRGSWTFDAKPKVDTIAGGDSSIWGDPYVDDWILMTDGAELGSVYWSAMGADGIDDELGIWLVGEGTEHVVAGNVYIDVDNATLTADQVQQIVDALIADVAPAYMWIHLGYVTGTVFTEYIYF